MKNKNPSCRRCHVEMKSGIGLQNSLSGLPDFPGGRVCTVSRTGPAEILKVWKCPKCGHSFEK